MEQELSGGLAVGVSERFEGLLSSIKLTDTQKSNGANARESVCQKLNLRYYSSSSSTDNSRFVGSWDKLTRIRPPRDVDVLFTLPDAVYNRFQARTGNRQSQLLQEVKEVLSPSYPNTEIRGDGPVVVVNLSTYIVELIPAFVLTNGQYWIPVTRNGGRYETSDYTAEETAIRNSNSTTKGNTRDLIRMAKCWQGVCSVPIKSFWLEIIAMNFLSQWSYAGNSKVYYDWMTRDFFIYLVNQSSTTIYAPGTYESISVGSTWKYKAETARDNAKSAIENEAGSYPNLARADWQKIFGSYIS